MTKNINLTSYGIRHTSGIQLYIINIKPLGAIRAAVLPEVRHFMGHTRMTTQGSQKKNYNNIDSVYIEASRPFCRNRIMNKMGVSAETANMSISQTDRCRAEYYAYYTKGNYWTNPVNYDMTLNSERVGIDRCVDVIRSYLRMKFPEGQF